MLIKTNALRQNDDQNHITMICIWDEVLHKGLFKINLKNHIRQ